VYCPSGARAKVEKLVPVAGDYDAVPSDDTVRAIHLDGMRGTEGVLQVKSEDGSTLVFNDAILNVPVAQGFMGFFLAPTGKPSVHAARAVGSACRGLPDGTLRQLSHGGCTAPRRAAQTREKP
jgi:hypothetical protein